MKMIFWGASRSRPARAPFVKTPFMPFTMMLGATWAACSSSPSNDGAATDHRVAVAATTSTSPLVCSAEADSTGPYRKFTASLTRSIEQPGLPDRVITVGVIQTERWLSSNTKEENQLVQLDGQPLFQSVIHRYSFTDEIDVFHNYYAPYQGVSSAVSSIFAGTIFATVDGRSIVPVPVGTSPSSITYSDGQPGPNVTLDPDVQQAMNDLLSATRSDASQCIVDDTSLPPGGVIGAPSPGPHQTDTRNTLACQSCRTLCAGIAGYCFYGTATSVGCGPFFFFCAVAGIVACTSSEVGCDKLCDLNDSACCPVGCGGEGNSNFFAPPPIGSSVGCCASGEECLNRDNYLCCAANTTPCGGTDCCSGDQTCMPDGRGGQTCCGAGSNCGGRCCPAGQFCGSVDGNPTCCQSCSTDADCGPGGNGSENVCESGCCVNIPG
jgi:hypothetical protein